MFPASPCLVLISPPILLCETSIESKCNTVSLHQNIGAKVVLDRSLIFDTEVIWYGVMRPAMNSMEKLSLSMQIFIAV